MSRVPHRGRCLDEEPGVELGQAPLAGPAESLGALPVGRTLSVRNGDEKSLFKTAIADTPVRCVVGRVSGLVMRGPNGVTGLFEKVSSGSATPLSCGDARRAGSASPGRPGLWSKLRCSA